MKKMPCLVGLSSVLFFFSCGAPDKQADENIVLEQTTSILSGEQLSRKYCQSCHLYPEPHTLDKNTWQRSVLPLMGRLFGIYEENVSRSEIIKGAINQKLVLEQNIFPQKQLISKEEWQKITDFYLSNAPDSAQFSTRKEVTYDPIEDFEVLKPYKGKATLPTTMIKIDPDNLLMYIG